MTLLLATTVAVLFGISIYLMQKEDLIRLAMGINLASNSVILFIVTAALTRGRAPIYPLPPEATVSDPLVQALALTAVVISFAIQALVLALVYSTYVSHRSIDQEELRQAEVEDVTEGEQP